jgi:hypothetical protein
MTAVLQVTVFKRKDELGLTLPSVEGVRRFGLKMIEAKSRNRKFEAFSMDIPILDISDVKYLENIIAEYYRDIKEDTAYRDNTITTLVEPSTVEEVIRLGALNNSQESEASIAELSKKLVDENQSTPITIDEVIDL